MQLMLTQPRIDIASNITVTAAFDPPVVRPGQLAVYHVSFNALEESIVWPQDIPVVPGLDIVPGAHGHALILGGGAYEPRSGFNFRVHAPEPGRFAIPEFSVKVVRQVCHGAGHRA